MEKSACIINILQLAIFYTNLIQKSVFNVRCKVAFALREVHTTLRHDIRVTDNNEEIRLSVKT